MKEASTSLSLSAESQAIQQYFSTQQISEQYFQSSDRPCILPNQPVASAIAVVSSPGCSSLDEATARISASPCLLLFLDIHRLQIPQRITAASLSEQIAGSTRSRAQVCALKVWHFDASDCSC